MKTFVLYKIKDIYNLRSILEIVKKYGIGVVVIKRNNIFFDYEGLDNIILIDEEEFLSRYLYKKHLIVETMGNKIISDFDLDEFDTIIFGSEDSGVDEIFISKLKNKEIAKIPYMKGSYNIVSSVTMVLSELLLQRYFKNKL